MKDQSQATQQDNESPARREYRAPALKAFGAVGVLTQAGSNGDTEMGMSMSMQMGMA